MAPRPHRAYEPERLKELQRIIDPTYQALAAKLGPGDAEDDDSDDSEAEVREKVECGSEEPFACKNLEIAKAVDHMDQWKLFSRPNIWGFYHPFQKLHGMLVGDLFSQPSSIDFWMPKPFPCRGNSTIYLLEMRVATPPGIFRSRICFEGHR